MFPYADGPIISSLIDPPTPAIREGFTFSLDYPESKTDHLLTGYVKAVDRLYDRNKTDRNNFKGKLNVHFAHVAALLSRTVGPQTEKG